MGKHKTSISPPISAMPINAELLMGTWAKC